MEKFNKRERSRDSNIRRQDSRQRQDSRNRNFRNEAFEKPRNFESFPLRSKQRYRNSESDSRYRSESFDIKQKALNRKGYKKHYKDEGFANFDKSNTSDVLQRVQAMQPMSTSKVDKKLYVGNIPSGISQNTLVELLNASLITIGANTEPGNPVLSAWIHSEGHYAFVEFRSIDEANNAYSLNNIDINGHKLKIGRPKTYNGNTPQTVTQAISNILMPQTSTINQVNPQQTQVALRRLELPTNILILRNILTRKELEDTEETEDIILDVKEECAKYGNVSNVVIPSYGEEGQGCIFIEFCDVEEAKSGKKMLGARKFNDKPIEVSFYPEDKFYMKDFSDASYSYAF